MSNSTSTSTDHVPEDMLLSVSNVQTWDVYILEHLIGYSHLGRAISTNSKYILLEPQQNDFIAGTQESTGHDLPLETTNSNPPHSLHFVMTCHDITSSMTTAFKMNQSSALFS